MSNIMEKLLKEEKEAEELLYGQSEENPSETEAPSPEVEEEETAPVEESSETSEETKDKTDPKPKRENWKKRYIGYKSSTDKTIRDLRLEVHDYHDRFKALEAKYNNLVEQYTKIRDEIESARDPFEGVFSQDDIDTLGPEALEAMKKAALATKVKEATDSSEVTELREEINRLKKAEQERKAAARAEEDDKSLRDLQARLERMIPKFSQIDNDPGFGEWLNDLDEASGQLKIDLLTNAVNSRDVVGVARFYKEYSESLEAPKDSFMDDYITPEADAVDSVAPDGRQNKKRYHISEYEEFMDELTKGTYRGREKEAKKIELAFDKAFLEGRVYE
jgi:uncharacterized phage infection (PIP) family protein YhgE